MSDDRSLSRSGRRLLAFGLVLMAVGALLWFVPVSVSVNGQPRFNCGPPLAVLAPSDPGPEGQATDDACGSAAMRRLGLSFVLGLVGLGCAAGAAIAAGNRRGPFQSDTT